MAHCFSLHRLTATQSILFSLSSKLTSYRNQTIVVFTAPPTIVCWWRWHLLHSAINSIALHFTPHLWLSPHLFALPILLPTHRFSPPPSSLSLSSFSLFASLFLFILLNITILLRFVQNKNMQINAMSVTDCALWLHNLYDLVIFFFCN